MLSAEFLSPSDVRIADLDRRGDVRPQGVILLKSDWLLVELPQEGLGVVPKWRIAIKWNCMPNDPAPLFTLIRREDSHGFKGDYQEAIKWSMGELERLDLLFFQRRRTSRDRLAKNQRPVVIDEVA